jgi:hypothetical protein
LLSDTKVQRGILVFVGDMDKEKLDKMKSILDAHNVNTFFYMAYNALTQDSSDHQDKDESANYNLIWEQVNLN